MARKREKTKKVDKERTNRSHKVRKTIQRGANRNVADGRQMPPVMVRSGSQHTKRRSNKKSGKSTLRRRFDVPLSRAGSQGVEMRLPSVPVVHPGWRILSFLLFAGSLVMLYYLLNAEIFKVKSVQVEGVVRLSVADVSSALGVVNKTIFSLNPLEMEEKLAETYSELTNVNVEINLPAQVMVRVNERVPMIAWVMENETLWIDGNGFIFPPRGEAEKMVSIFANVSPPMITLAQSDEDESLPMEEEAQAYLPQEDIDAIFVLKTQAPEGTALMYDGNHGYGWTDPRGWQVFFGTKMQDIDSKLLVYQAVVKKLEGEGITPNLINVAYLHAPYYR